MPDGEIIYPQKADSLKTFPGKNRIQLEWVIVDPKVTSCKIFYEQGGIQGDTIVPINAVGSYKNDTIRVTIPNLEETTYAFKIVSYDDFGHVSIPVETEESAYGEVYERTLFNRVLRSVDYDEDEGLHLEWYEADDSEIGIILEYTDINGSPQKLKVDKSETITEISDFKIGEPLYCRTMYKPVPAAIDTFSAESQRVVIQKEVNVAYKKPCTASSDFGSGLTPDKAVDGDKTTNSGRWVTANNVFTEHWLEIDLLGTYDIYKFAMWRQYNATQRMPIWDFQAWIDGAWVTVISETDAGVVSAANNTYFKEFDPPVTTNKVRWYVPAYENNMVRLYEIELWSIVSF